jgi:DNA polymerase-3 subunit delta'
MAKDAEALEQRADWLKDVNHLLGEGHVERFAYADRISKDRELLQKMLEVWLSFWRDVLIKNSQKTNKLSNVDYEEQITSLAGSFSQENILKLVRTIKQTLVSLKGNANPRLAIESLLLSMPKIAIG